MPDLVVVVPSRGRPGKVLELLDAFEQTCTAGTRMLVAVDEVDPCREGYTEAAARGAALCIADTDTMNEALNEAAVAVITDGLAAVAVGFMGDDHRPRTVGWDQAYLDALRDMSTGIVYGNDLLQGERLPTQCAMTVDIVRALGYMAPPELVHLYLDDFWRTLGQRAGCLRYLADVVVEHVHPIAGKAEWDEGYERVNNPAMYERDREAFAEYFRTRLVSDVAKVRALSKVDR